MRAGITQTQVQTPAAKISTANNIQQAIADNNLHTLHRAITEWANTPERRVALNQADMQPSWHALERHLFGSGPAPTAEALQTLASALKQQTAAAPPTDKVKKAHLSSLY